MVLQRAGKDALKNLEGALDDHLDLSRLSLLVRPRYRADLYQSTPDFPEDCQIVNKMSTFVNWRTGRFYPLFIQKLRRAPFLPVRGLHEVFYRKQELNNG